MVVCGDSVSPGRKSISRRIRERDVEGGHRGKARGGDVREVKRE